MSVHMEQIITNHPARSNKLIASTKGKSSPFLIKALSAAGKRKVTLDVRKTPPCLTLLKNASVLTTEKPRKQIRKCKALMML